MGKWATYQRRGGGPPTATAVIQMIDALVEATAEASATYNGTVDPGDFDATTFHSFPTGEEAIIVSPISPTKLLIVFDNSILGDTTLTYNGSVPGILTPQTIAY